MGGSYPIGYVIIVFQCLFTLPVSCVMFRKRTVNISTPKFGAPSRDNILIDIHIHLVGPGNSLDVSVALPSFAFPLRFCRVSVNVSVTFPSRFCCVSVRVSAALPLGIRLPDGNYKK